jgi:ribosome-binding protein aMBF1 (putative translation factor)
MKVCEVCGSKELEDNEEELNRRILHVCETCVTDQKPVPKEDD